MNARGMSLAIQPILPHLNGVIPFLFANEALDAALGAGAFDDGQPIS